MIVDVYDLPIWADCPFRETVPEYIEIRRSGHGQQGMVSLWDDAHQMGVDIYSWNPSVEKEVKPALYMLEKAREIQRGLR